MPTECASGAQRCVAGGWGECDSAGRLPDGGSLPEVPCDGLDNNCNGAVDEGSCTLRTSGSCFVCGRQGSRECIQLGATCGWESLCTSPLPPSETFFRATDVRLRPPSLATSGATQPDGSVRVTARGFDAFSGNPGASAVVANGGIPLGVGTYEAILRGRSVRSNFVVEISDGETETAVPRTVLARATFELVGGGAHAIGFTVPAASHCHTIYFKVTLNAAGSDAFQPTADIIFESLALSSPGQYSMFTP